MEWRQLHLPTRVLGRLPAAPLACQSRPYPDGRRTTRRTLGTRVQDCQAARCTAPVCSSRSIPFRDDRGRVVCAPIQLIWGRAEGAATVTFPSQFFSRGASRVHRMGGVGKACTSGRKGPRHRPKSAEKPLQKPQQTKSRESKNPRRTSSVARALRDFQALSTEEAAPLDSSSPRGAHRLPL